MKRTNQKIKNIKSSILKTQSENDKSGEPTKENITKESGNANSENEHLKKDKLEKTQLGTGESEKI